MCFRIPFSSLNLSAFQEFIVPIFTGIYLVVLFLFLIAFIYWVWVSFHAKANGNDTILNDMSRDSNTFRNVMHILSIFSLFFIATFNPWFTEWYDTRTLDIGGQVREIQDYKSENKESISMPSFLVRMSLGDKSEEFEVHTDAEGLFQFKNIKIRNSIKTIRLESGQEGYMVDGSPPILEFYVPKETDSYFKPLYVVTDSIHEDAYKNVNAKIQFE